MDYSSTSKLLDIYSLEDIINLNELTNEDVLMFLFEQEFLKIPDIKPVDYEA